MCHVKREKRERERERERERDLVTDGRIWRVRRQQHVDKAVYDECQHFNTKMHAAKRAKRKDEAVKGGSGAGTWGDPNGEQL